MVGDLLNELDVPRYEMVSSIIIHCSYFLAVEKGWLPKKFDHRK
ncbi:hypothetical protein SAM19_04147 [Brevibacillus laterosporus]|nr:hypothetical protein [Brevibacillus laterosporus]